MTRLLLLCTLAVGCGSETGRNNHGLGYDYAQIGETGLRVRYEAGQTTPSLTDIETIFREVETCIGTKAMGPLVIFINFATAGIQYSDTSLGQTYLDTGTVMVNTAIATDEKYIYWTLKHEFIHYLLNSTGLSYAENSAHQSPLFLDCGSPLRSNH